MGIGDQISRQQFPVAAARVYANLPGVLEGEGFKIVSRDDFLKRVTASAGMSLLSWGENITVGVNELSPTASEVSVESSLKLGTSWTGAHRNQKNIEKIISALSRSLRD
jgi:hypothetical protein